MIPAITKNRHANFVISRRKYVVNVVNSPCRIAIIALLSTGIVVVLLKFFKQASSTSNLDIHEYLSRSLQDAQLSQRDRAMLRVIEYFAKSLKATQSHSK